MSGEHIRQTFNAYLLFFCPTSPPKAHKSELYLKLRVLLSLESNENFDEHCAQLTIQYRQNQVTARRIPVSKTMILFKPISRYRNEIEQKHCLSSANQIPRRHTLPVAVETPRQERKSIHYNI